MTTTTRQEPDMTETETTTTTDETETIVTVRAIDIARDINRDRVRFDRCDDVDVFDDDTADRWLSMILLDATAVGDVIVFDVIDMVDGVVTTFDRPRSARMLVTLHHDDDDS